MKKTEVINSNISRVITQMGYSGKLDVDDADMPMPRTTEKIDLTVTNGVPSFMGVLNNILEGLAVQRVYLTGEIKAENPDVLITIKTRLPETPVSFILHTGMEQGLNNCHTFIQIGEMTPYANILLESNVVF